MADRVYLSRSIQDRVRALGHPVREFVHDSVLRAVELEESKAKAPPDSPAPAPTPEPTPEEIEESLASVEISFDHLGKKNPSPPTEPARAPLQFTGLSDATMARFGFNSATDDDLRELVLLNPRLAPAERWIETYRAFQAVEAWNPDPDREWYEIAAKELGRPLTLKERVDLIRSARKRAGLTPKERR